MLYVVLLIIFKIIFFSKNSPRNTFKGSNSSDSDQDSRFVGPDLGSSSLQRLSEDDPSRQRVYPLVYTNELFYLV